MGEHVDHAQFTQSGEAQRAAHVVREDEEGASIGDQTAVVISDAIEDGGHGVFPNTEVQALLRVSG